MQVEEKILLLLLADKRKKTLDELWHSVKVEACGPTSDAAHQHVLRIYHQTQEWRGEYGMDPLKWHCQLTRRRIMPIEMTEQVAPPELLKIIKYGFKTYYKRKNCTFRQYGDVYTNICASCKGLSCMNCEPINDTNS